ncbi:isopentenyl-diphosphate Delta-isomerase [Photobacterium galatheae]|uniref:Isopentenyl-diphosphate Delta-isomerase n=1 Tax=Photobacterium galatheae TaxID=1654360 RepID=A0A066RPP5_9GAMM|nr:isopentenyl-diphosphate Delta-isomerase [Photobacterium galatheae]KDM92435.1 isopentenyl-diphosphate delta-isomerase [Photobacterium galatheae]MCM0147915.1 isopentenyl-diphosphate Delta-isomerase [Photobacterium galatheae]
MRQEFVILVNQAGEHQGLAEKMQAHRDGLLHLAFSVLLYRETQTGREFLLQQRALEKYHSGGLWTNTCCSHPREGESLQQAATRRLGEEMGINDVVHVDEVARFVYRAALDNDLVEHELDAVLVAEVPALAVAPNPEEVMAYRWWPEAELSAHLAQSPETFTAWFSEVYRQTLASLSR